MLFSRLQFEDSADKRKFRTIVAEEWARVRTYLYETFWRDPDPLMRFFAGHHVQRWVSRPFVPALVALLILLAGGIALSSARAYSFLPRFSYRGYGYGMRPGPMGGVQSYSDLLTYGFLAVYFSLFALSSYYPAEMIRRLGGANVIREISLTRLKTNEIGLLLTRGAWRRMALPSLFLYWPAMTIALVSFFSLTVGRMFGRSVIGPEGLILLEILLLPLVLLLWTARKRTRAGAPVLPLLAGVCVLAPLVVYVSGVMRIDTAGGVLAVLWFICKPAWDYRANISIGLWLFLRTGNTNYAKALSLFINCVAFPGIGGTLFLIGDGLWHTALRSTRRCMG